jgi:hypothetical protein
MSANPYHPLSPPGDASSQSARSAVPNMGAGHVIRAAFVYDAEYFLEAIARYHAMHRLRGLRKAILVLVGIAMMAFGILLLLGGSRGPVLLGCFCVASGVFVVVSNALQRWILKRRFRGNPDEGDTFVVVMDDEGYRVTSRLHDAKMAWAAFTAVKEFPDGVLLMQGKQLCRWVPFRALSDPGDRTILFPYITSRILP